MCGVLYLTLVRFLIGTGVRIREALGLKESDIDWRREEIKIRRNLPIHRQMEGPKPKAGRRTLEVEEGLMQELRSHLAARKALALAGKVESCNLLIKRMDPLVSQPPHFQ